MVRTTTAGLAFSTVPNVFPLPVFLSFSEHFITHLDMSDGAFAALFRRPDFLYLVAQEGGALEVEL